MSVCYVRDDDEETYHHPTAVHVVAEASPDRINTVKTLVVPLLVAV